MESDQAKARRLLLLLTAAVPPTSQAHATLAELTDVVGALIEKHDRLSMLLQEKNVSLTRMAARVNQLELFKGVTCA